MPEYDDRGKVALWKTKSDHPKAPKADGTVVAVRDIKEGETVRIALWKSDSTNPKAPIMYGKLSDPMEQEKKAPPQPAGGFDDDDIPF